MGVVGFACERCSNRSSDRVDGGSGFVSKEEECGFVLNSAPAADSASNLWGIQSGVSGVSPVLTNMSKVQTKVASQKSGER